MAVLQYRHGQTIERVCEKVTTPEDVRNAYLTEFVSQFFSGPRYLSGPRKKGNGFLMFPKLVRRFHLAAMRPSVLRITALSSRLSTRRRSPTPRTSCSSLPTPRPSMWAHCDRFFITAQGDMNFFTPCEARFVIMNTDRDTMDAMQMEELEEISAQSLGLEIQDRSLK